MVRAIRGACCHALRCVASPGPLSSEVIVVASILEYSIVGNA